MILSRTSVSKRFAIAIRNPVRYTFPRRHSVARSSCKIAEPQNRNARVNKRMHRNAAASLFHMDNLPAASGDAGRYLLDTGAAG